MNDGLVTSTRAIPPGAARLPIAETAAIHDVTDVEFAQHRVELRLAFGLRQRERLEDRHDVVPHRQLRKIEGSCARYPIPIRARRNSGSGVMSRRRERCALRRGVRCRRSCETTSSCPRRWVREVPRPLPAPPRHQPRPRPSSCRSASTSPRADSSRSLIGCLARVAHHHPHVLQNLELVEVGIGHEPHPRCHVLTVDDSNRA